MSEAMTEATQTLTVLAVTKPWWRSKMVWFNIAIALLALLELKTEWLVQILPPAVYPYVALGVAGINAVLRVVTATGLTLTAAKEING